MAFVFFVGLGFGVLLGSWQDNPSAADIGTDIILDRDEDHTSEQVNFDLFWDVWDQVHAQYVDQPLNEEDLLYGAISGMVAGLKDPHSAFLPPEESAEFFSEINDGSFQGIGAEIGIRNDQLTVIAPLAGSPAQQAGVQAGDIIIAIDETDATFLSLYAAVSQIRGEKGTEVVLTVLREGDNGKMKEIEIPVTRDVIVVHSVKSEFVEKDGKNLAVITLSSFNRDTEVEFQEAIREITLEQPDGIVLDLRNNPGGFLDVAVTIASHFVPENNVVVWKREPDTEDLPLYTTGNAELADYPVAVLINAGSASASEILAAALVENGKAVTVGETSFGKGTVQDVVSLDNGSSLKITIARWLTTEKNLIDEVGVTPTYTIELTEEDVNKDRDPQLNAAQLYFTDREALEQRANSSKQTNE